MVPLTPFLRVIERFESRRFDSCFLIKRGNGDASVALAVVTARQDWEISSTPRLSSPVRYVSWNREAFHADQRWNASAGAGRSKTEVPSGLAGWNVSCPITDSCIVPTCGELCRTDTR